MSTIVPDNSRQTRFDVVVIGSGPAGKLAATVAFREGAEVALICERASGCETLPPTVSRLHGPASFLSPHAISVAERSVEATSFVIAMGSVARRPTLQGVPLERTCTADEMRQRRGPLPARIAVLGATTCGLEFAQRCARGGARVTVLDTTATLLPDAPSCSDLLSQALRREFDIRLGAHIVGANASPRGVQLHLARPEPDSTVSVDLVVFALGRSLKVDHLSLERAEVDRYAGVPLVDAFRRTTNPRVLIAGDDTADPEGLSGFEKASELAGYNAVHVTNPRPFSPPLPMTMLMTHPTYARVGEPEANTRRKVGQLFTASAPARRGIVRMWCDGEGNVLGGEALGPGADLLVHLIAHTIAHGSLMSGRAIHYAPRSAAHALALLRDTLVAAARSERPGTVTQGDRLSKPHASDGRVSVTLPASG